MVSFEAAAAVVAKARDDERWMRCCWRWSPEPCCRCCPKKDEEELEPAALRLLLTLTLLLPDTRRH
jgi:hypothetical protein